jgi:hypothetical protein
LWLLLTLRRIIIANMNDEATGKGAKARFGALLKGALVFACGAVYGIFEWYRDGWRIVDLVYLLFPIGIAVYLFWAAFKAKQRAGGADAP